MTSRVASNSVCQRRHLTQPRAISRLTKYISMKVAALRSLRMNSARAADICIQFTQPLNSS